MVEVFKGTCECGFKSKELHLGKRNDEPFNPYIKISGYFNDKTLNELFNSLDDLTHDYRYLSIPDDYKIKYKKSEKKLSKQDYEEELKSFLKTYFSKIHEESFKELIKMSLKEQKEDETYHELIIFGENQKFSVNRWVEIMDLNRDKYSQSLLDVIIKHLEPLKLEYTLFLYRSYEDNILNEQKQKSDLIDIVSVYGGYDEVPKKILKPSVSQINDIRQLYSYILSFYDYYERPVWSQKGDDWVYYENNRIYEEFNKLELMTVIKCCYDCNDICLGGIYFPSTPKSFNNSNCFKCGSNNTKMFYDSKNNQYNNYFGVDNWEPPDDEEYKIFETKFSEINFLYKWEFEKPYDHIVYFMEDKKYKCPKCHKDNLIFNKISTLWYQST